MTHPHTSPPEDAGQSPPSAKPDPTVRLFMTEGLPAEPAPAAGSSATAPNNSTVPPLLAPPPQSNPGLAAQDPLLSGRAHFPGYRILRMLGQGGMGTVYEAEQQVPRRRVALKVVNPGQASIGMLKRMEREAQVLGLLHHPGIAQIYEAGTFNGGGGEQPFFVMELVDGLPLTDYVRRHEPTTRARLELLARIADAVQHAHQKGIIHRDLKPDNILVEAGGQPRVLDFGVARIIDSEAGSPTMSTRMGAIIGTLPYMSPEQASGENDKIDTRADVYALGVIGYEMLAGKLPLDLDNLTLIEAAIVIREKEPPPLSRLDRSLRGDVENIIGKALEKERDRRYQSAAEFAADLRRHLNDEPIIALTPTTMYQLKKFARRNKALVGAAGLAILALLAGLGLALWQARIADRERGEAVRAREVAAQKAEIAERAREEAKNQALNAQQAADFLAGIFEMIDPEASEIRRVSARDLLDAGMDRLSGDSINDPAIRFRLLGLIGRAYRGVGESAKSADLYRHMLDEARAQNPPNLRLEIEALYGLANALNMPATLAEGIAPAREGLELARAKLGKDDELTQAGIGILGNLLYRKGRVERDELAMTEAIPLLRGTMEAEARRHGTGSDEHVAALNLLARALSTQGESPKEAEELFLHAVELLSARTNAKKSLLSRIYSNLGDHYLSSEPEDTENAGKYYLQALDVARQSPNDPVILYALNSIGLFESRPGRSIEKAKSYYEEYLRLQPTIMAQPDLELAHVEQRLAVHYLRGGRNKEALELAKNAFEALRDRVDPCGKAEKSLGEVFYTAAMAAGGPSEAAKVVEEFTAWRGENCGELSKANAEALALKAKVAYALGNKEESRTLRAREKEVRSAMKEQADEEQ